MLGGTEKHLASNLLLRECQKLIKSSKAIVARSLLPLQSGPQHSALPLMPTPLVTKILRQTSLNAEMKISIGDELGAEIAAVGQFLIALLLEQLLLCSCLQVG